MRLADLPTRQAQYEKYKLVMIPGEGWGRQDGTYKWNAIKDLAQQYPETEDIYDRAGTRATILVVTGYTGAALVGFTLGWNNSGPDSKDMSSSAQVALYSIGGGLLVGSLIALVAWHNPALDFADAYNGALARDLRLTDVPDPRSAVSPTVLGGGGFGWRF